MRYQIHHRTTYDYSYPVSVSHHAATLRPLTDSGQTCNSFDLRIDPQPSDLLQRTDFFDNTVQLFSIQDSHERLVVDANSDVTVQSKFRPIEGYRLTVGDSLERIRTEWSSGKIDTVQYAYPSPHVVLSDTVRQLSEKFFRPNQDFVGAACALAAHIHDAFEFDSSATDVSTPIDEVIETKRGVCQDYAHVMIAALRAARLPARYVSGYILTHPPEGQPRLVGADASHAWVSVYAPEVGWIEIDPTNRQFCHLEHVKVAVGRDYSDVSMIRGALTGGDQHEIAIEVTMTPLNPQKPERYTLSW